MRPASSASAAASVVLASLAGCAGPGAAPAPAGAVILRAPGWAPANRARIEAFLREHGAGSQAYDPARPPCAALDLDMTSIFDDVGDATFYFQVATLTLMLSPADLAAHLPAAFASQPGRSLAAERQEALDAHALLHAAGLTGPPGRALDLRARLAVDPGLARAHAVFRHRMLWLYQRLEEVDGARVAYPWVAGVYQGLTPAHMAPLVDAVLARELRDPARGERCTTVVVRHPDAQVEPLTIREGLVANPEMRELYAALRASGLDPYVVSASFGRTVEVIAARLLDVPADHVVGMRLALRPDGAFSGAVLRPITYREGKVEAIRASLPRAPIFAAGDSDTDVEMLSMESVQLRLLLDRRRDPASDIGRLCARAREPGADAGGWLIQGRDDFGPDGTASGAWNGTTRTP